MILPLDGKGFNAEVTAHAGARRPTPERGAGNSLHDSVRGEATLLMLPKAARLFELGIEDIFQDETAS